MQKDDDITNCINCNLCRWFCEGEVGLNWLHSLKIISFDRFLLQFLVLVILKNCEKNNKCYTLTSTTLKYVGNYQKKRNFDLDRTRTCNPQIRSLMPYPLGHKAAILNNNFSFVLKNILNIKGTVNDSLPIFLCKLVGPCHNLFANYEIFGP